MAILVSFIHMKEPKVTIKVKSRRHRATPKRDGIVAAIRKQAEKLQPAQALPSERELALHHGVSRKTIRAALAELELKGVVAAANGKGCRSVPVPASGSGVLADTVVLLSVTDPDLLQDVGSEGWLRFIDIGASDAVREAGLHLMVLNPTTLGMTAFRRFLGGNPTGVLCTQRVVELPNWQEMLAAMENAACRLVLYGDYAGFEKFDHVSSDHAAGASALIHLLFEHGCRRILRVWTVPDDEGRRWVTERNAGYEKACRELDLPILPQISLPNVDPIESQTHWIAGYLLDIFKNTAYPDAFMAVTDADALALGTALKLLGHDNIPVVGYDNYWLPMVQANPKLVPPFATVDKRNRDIGRAMARLLLDRTSGRLAPNPQHIKLEPKVLPRD